jgi:hypothetical protein
MPPAFRHPGDDHDDDDAVSGASDDDNNMAASSLALAPSSLRLAAASKPATAPRPSASRPRSTPASTARRGITVVVSPVSAKKKKNPPAVSPAGATASLATPARPLSLYTACACSVM